MKILITGGHLTPALATIAALPKNIEIFYVGRKYTFEGDLAESLEYKCVTEKGIKFISLSTARLQRKLTRYTIPSLLKLPRGFFEAKKIIEAFKPDVILSFGGYISLPVCLAGAIKKIPLVLHEQTFGAGLANRLVARFAKKICISWESSHDFFPKDKTVLTGNPVYKGTRSKEVKELLQKVGFPLVVIVGGSSGSHAINTLVEKSLPMLLQHTSIIHQTGDAKQFGDYDRLVNFKKQLPENLQKKYMLSKFFMPDDIFPLFEKATVVVSRAGINTVLTLFLLQKPSLLIPLMVSQQDEQMKNAEFLEHTGLGKTKTQGALREGLFAEEVLTMLQDIKLFKNTAGKDLFNLHERAAQKVAEITLYAGQRSDL